MSKFVYLPTQPDQTGRCGFIRRDFENLLPNEKLYFEKIEGLVAPRDTDKIRQLAQELLFSPLNKETHEQSNQ